MSYQFVIIHNNAPIYNCCFTYTWVNIRVYIIHLFNQHATDIKIRLSKYSSQIQSTNGPDRDTSGRKYSFNESFGTGWE